jgi:hypothetical protein
MTFVRAFYLLRSPCISIVLPCLVVTHFRFKNVLEPSLSESQTLGPCIVLEFITDE